LRSTRTARTTLRQTDERHREGGKTESTVGGPVATEEERRGDRTQQRQSTDPTHQKRTASHSRHIETDRQTDSPAWTAWLGGAIAQGGRQTDSRQGVGRRAGRQDGLTDGWMDEAIRLTSLSSHLPSLFSQPLFVSRPEINKKADHRRHDPLTHSLRSLYST